MMKEMYSVKCPEHIVFGDPWYFKTEPEDRLKSLVVDCIVPKEFEAIVSLESMVRDGNDCKIMHIYLAPKGEAELYANGMCYESQEVKQRPIPVDTAEYKLKIDGREDIVHTGADGYWGSYLCFYDKGDTSKRPEASVIAVYMPDYEDFKDMRNRMEFFFQDIKPLEKSPEKEKPKSR